MAGVLIAPNLIWRPFDSVPGCSTTRANLSTILQSLSEYAITHDGKYPDTLQALVTPDAKGNGYLEGFDGRIPRDSWKREYAYLPPTPAHPLPLVFSLGKDGEPGGEGDDADIDSDHLKDEDP